MPAGDGWIHELKHDGFRVLAFKDGDAVRLWSRNGRDWAGEFVAIDEPIDVQPQSNGLVVHGAPVVVSCVPVSSSW